VIPQAIGGILRVPFLCNPCNHDKLGALVEAAAKKDPSIRLALEEIRSLAPKLTAQLTERQEYIAESPRGKVRGVLRNGEFRVHAKKQFDGSVIQPTPQGRKHIKKHLRETGAGQQEIDQTLRQLDAAPENTLIPVDAGLQVIKWSVGSLQPTLDGNPLSDQVVLKIAYEFVACIVGSQVYSDIPVLSAARRALHDQLDPGAILRIERLHAAKYDAFHGVAFEGNQPHTVIQARLFGWLAFRIHFHGLVINAPRIVYTHRLDTNKEGWGIADKSQNVV
jgi:hypothetical protein